MSNDNDISFGISPEDIVVVGSDEEQTHTVPETGEVTQEAQQDAVVVESNEEPPALDQEQAVGIEERLDDLMDMVAALQGTIDAVIEMLTKQASSIDGIAPLVVNAVTTTLQYAGPRPAPAAPSTVQTQQPAEEAPKGGLSEAEQRNQANITALKERRS